MAATRLLLAGAGHAHLEVLRRLCRHPDPTLDVTLVSPESHVIYTGMLPGVVAGQYSTAQSEIDVAALARRADARFHRGSLAGIDLDNRDALLERGKERFDVLSLDVGSVTDTTLPGAREHSIAVRPPRLFLELWRRLQDEIEQGRVRTVAMVGGGAAGIEMTLAMQWRLAGRFGERAPRLVLVTDQPQLLRGHAPKARRLLGRVLVSRGIIVRLNARVVSIDENGVVMTDHGRIAADRVVVAATPAAPPWLRSTGLECDAEGFVRVNQYLQSVSHAFVFAAGDCAARIDGQSRKGGVHAVRDAAPLDANLRRYTAGRPMIGYRPRSLALALIATGNRSAVASWGRFAGHGAWAWHWKDTIDRRFVERFRAPRRAR